MKRLVLMIGGVWCLGSCGPGAAAEAIRPKDPSAANALGEAPCRDVKSGAAPLVVDWKPEQRGDLEVAMKEGVAVVAYSCDSIKLLTDCHIDGEYGYIGMTRKEQVVRLENADEVKANLPLSGVTLGGEMSRGSTLDIAMVMVGKRRTTWNEPGKDDLKGSCDGATHYVSGAVVGAFAVDVGTRAKARVAAEILGAGAEGSSQSSKQTKNREGDAKDCNSATPDSEKPPAQCGAPIRLSLLPINLKAAEPPSEKDAKPAPPATDKACPEGLVLAEGKCTSKDNAPAFLCSAGNGAECTAQCKKGHAGSCAVLGEMYLSGNGVSRDAKQAQDYLKQGCDTDVGEACALLGQLVLASDAAQASAAFDKACSAGAARGCRGLGDLKLKSEAGRAAELYSRACDGGDDQGCAALAGLYSSGNGVTADPKRALELDQRACNGSVGDSCARAGRAYELGGPGIGKNPILAQINYRRGCYRGSAQGCFYLGMSEYATNPTSSKQSLMMACIRQDRLACAALFVAFGEQRGSYIDPQRQQQLMQSCTSGNVGDCTLVGLFEAAAKSGMAKLHFQRACTSGDKFACEMVKKIP